MSRDIETYTYLTGDMQTRRAQRMPISEKRDAWRKLQEQGYSIYQLPINDHEFAYWYQKEGDVENLGQVLVEVNKTGKRNY